MIMKTNHYNFVKELIHVMNVFDPKPDVDPIDNCKGTFIEEPIYDPLIAFDKFKEKMHHGRKHKRCNKDEKDKE